MTELFLDDTRHLGKPLLHYRRLESTNDLAQEFATDAKNHGTCILADFQTKGRGQYGRVWQAPPESSLLLSVLLFPPPELFRPVLLTALAAVGVCETVEADARIKWPNDVLVGGKKVCGTLIECGSPRWAVIGVGLNLNQTQSDFNASGLTDATSLRLLTGNAHSVIETARILLKRLDDWYDLLLNRYDNPLERLWSERIGLVGREVVVKLHPDLQRIGTLREIAFDGVVLETADGTVEAHRPESVRGITPAEAAT